LIILKKNCTIYEICNTKIKFKALIYTLPVHDGAEMQKIMNWFVIWLIAAVKNLLELPYIDKEIRN